MVRKDISRLRKNRALHFQIGLCAALFFSLTCLNWTVIDDKSHEPPNIYVPEDIFEIDAPPRTKEAKPIPPPPPPVVSNFITDEDPPKIFDIEPTPKPEPVTVPQNAVVKQPAPPVAPPPPPVIKVSDKPDFFKIVEEMPRFGDCSGLKTKEERKACSDKSMMEFMYSKIKYPAIARENGIEGMVVIQFLIDKKGKILNAKVVREIGGGCGKEALRIVNEMPAWSPGKQRNEPVKVLFNLPIKFQLD